MITAVSDPPDIEMETTDSAVGEDFYEEGANRFWVKNSHGDWVHVSQNAYKLVLKSRGLCPICDSANGQVLSPVDQQIEHVMLEQRVQYAGPLAGWKRGLRQFQDTRALVTRSPSLIKPVAGPWPLLRELLESRFSTGPVDQLPYLLGWWQHMLFSLYEGKPSRGLCLVLAGEAGSGKTLLKDVIKMSTGGREVYPYDWMTGRDTFNKELTQCVCWVVDDESADTSGRGRNAFGAQIKKVVANTAMRCRGMYQDGFTLEPLCRLIVCVNCELDKIQVIPELADDINDKLLILLVKGGPFPMAMRTQVEKRAFFQAVCDELPAFTNYLLHEYRLPDEYVGERFGVAPYHNAEVVGMLHELSTESELDQVIQKYLFSPGEDFWSGTAAELLAVLTSDGSNVPTTIKRAPYFRGQISLGKTLGKLEAVDPDHYRKHRTASKREWVIHRKDPAQAEDSPL